MRKIKTLILALGVLISSNLLAVELTPSDFGEYIGTGDTGYKEYTIKNDTSTRARYKIFFTGNEDKFDIQVYPKVLLLEPYADKKVKVLIKKKSGATVENGEYKFSVTVSPIKVPVLNDGNTELGKVEVSAEFGLAVGLGMYGYVGELGDPEKDLKVSNLKFDKGKKEVSFTLENGMKRSFKLSVIARQNKKDYEMKTDITRIAGGDSKEIRLPMKKLKDLESLDIYNAETGKLVQTIKL